MLRIIDCKYPEGENFIENFHQDKNKIKLINKNFFMFLINFYFLEIFMTNKSSKDGQLNSFQEMLQLYFSLR